MDDNTNNTQWYLKGSLKEWGMIIGAIGFFYLNIAGNNAFQKTIADDVADIKKNQKEMQMESKISEKEKELRINKLELEIEILKKTVEYSNRPRL